LSRLASPFSTRLIISLRTAIPHAYPPHTHRASSQKPQPHAHIPDASAHAKAGRYCLIFQTFIPSYCSPRSLCWLELCQPPPSASSESLISSTTSAARGRPRIFTSQKTPVPLQDIKHGLDYRRQQAGLAAGLYVVLYGGLSSLIPNESPQEASYKPRPPACGAAGDA